MKKAVKRFSLFLAFCMIFSAMQVSAASVLTASSDELYRLSLQGDAPYAEADLVNGSKYISIPPTPTFWAMSFELFQPLRGTGTSDEAFAPSNALSFDLTVNEAPGADNAFIAFNPKERVVTGGNTRPWAIMIGADGSFHVRDNGSYKNTGIAYELGQSYAFEIAFNFTDYTYTVSINGIAAAENFAFTGGLERDPENRPIAALPNNMGIISAISPKEGSFELRNISAGISNLVDDDAAKNMGETNPVINADGTKTYFVGPNRIYQKPQDVVYFLRPGDVVEIEGNATYPGGLHYSVGNGTVAGTEEQPITFRGVAVNGNRPVLLSAGAVNVVEINADNIVLEGIEVRGHLYRAMAVRGFTDHNAFVAAYPARDEAGGKISFRGIYLAGGDNLVIRDCIVHGNYHGIHSSAALGNVLIEHSEIYMNGTDTQGHNVYLDSKLNAVATVRYNYIHDTVLLSNNGLKSRFWRNEVHYNRFENLAQAMELIGQGERTETPRDSEIVGNLIINCRQGMRLGGDGVGIGTRGRYRVMNNTYANINNGNAYFLRTFTQIESVELYNNVVYSSENLRFWTSIDSQWIDTVRIYGRDNWFSQPLEVTAFPYQMARYTLGEGNPFVDVAAGDFRINANNAAGQSVLAISASPADTVVAWPLVEGRDSATFANPLTTLSSQPVDKNGVVADRPASSLGIIGALVSTEATAVSLYSDVSIYDAQYDAVEFVTENGLFGGVGYGRFAPNAPMTRAMFATVLYNLSGAAVVPDGAYDDVSATAYYAAAVDFVVSNGFLRVSDNLFRPDEAISGTEMSAALAAYADAEVNAAKDSIEEFIVLYANASGSATRIDAAQLFMDFLTIISK